MMSKNTAIKTNGPRQPTLSTKKPPRIGPTVGDSARPAER